MRPQGPWEKRRKLQLEGWHEAIGAAIKIWETAARVLPRGHRGSLLFGSLARSSLVLFSIPCVSVVFDEVDEVLWYMTSGCQTKRVT